MHGIMTLATYRKVLTVGISGKVLAILLEILTGLLLDTRTGENVQYSLLWLGVDFVLIPFRYKRTFSFSIPNVLASKLASVSLL